MTGNRVVIPGGSGQVGQMVMRGLLSRGWEVVLLSRGTPSLAPHPNLRIVPWDGQHLGPWTSELEGATLVLNLAGRSVNCRYHRANREAILGSRVESTRILGQAIAQCQRPPLHWFNASTATIYRHALDRPMDEITGELGGREPGVPDTWNFSIGVATAWEEAFDSAPVPDTVRRVALRSAMTMSPDPGGVFSVLRNLVQWGLGGTQGPGNQYVSWIHEADFLEAILFLVDHPGLTGPVNLASPHPVPNREFMAQLRRAAGMPLGLPATKWMLEIGALFLRTETELILKSRQVIPTRLLQAGFQFQYPHWPEAAQDLCRRYGSRKV